MTILNVFCGHIIAVGQGHGMLDTMNSLKEPGMRPEYILQMWNHDLVLRELRLKQSQWRATDLLKLFLIMLRDNGIDLIIIATHGYTGMKKLMFGSVALEVLHSSHVPVLLIRPESCRT